MQNGSWEAAAAGGSGWVGLGWVGLDWIISDCGSYSPHVILFVSADLHQIGEKLSVQDIAMMRQLPGHMMG